ncbi:MAG TPA: hypothetical protein IAD23_07240 [Candidatus Scubalenecus merdavium]|uniref:Bifunctional riboflavin kinase/FMN adenylyltransferase n=1 Tax=Candidatus Scybalenecus merdavium TaxID=2840939 RepID=A0A9D1MW96_9FIRM|nr:hypothetical protein [Candidatus Scubalenecus merdavium]
MEKQRKAVALGDFDGMHRAHQMVVTGAENAVIYCVHNRFSLLQKSIFLRRYPNTQFADFDLIRNLPGEAFIEQILLDRLGAETVLCGFNFRFGRGASWSAMDLRRYCEARGVWVRILEHLDYGGEPISSTRIRAALAQGDIRQANEMLGYAFTFENEVMHGDQRGRTIDFPTINQYLPQGLVMPKYGVYESRTEVDGILYKSFTNIGLRPTWQVDWPLCETHIFGYRGDLYGRTVRVELVDYLRGEKKFSTVEELKQQLEYDKSRIV